MFVDLDLSCGLKNGGTRVFVVCVFVGLLDSETDTPIPFAWLFFSSCIIIDYILPALIKDDRAMFCWSFLIMTLLNRGNEIIRYQLDVGRGMNAVHQARGY